jgi:hypothetical protein
LWRDMPAKHPGLQTAKDQRAGYYLSRNRPIPQFPRGLESRRVIYGCVDLRYGIVRAGGAGMVTALGPHIDDCCRATLKRFADHIYSAWRIQKKLADESLPKHKHTHIDKINCSRLSTGATFVIELYIGCRYRIPKY